ncbi:MAG: T9SS type A sorting domain-containing protein [Bacteroidetes bacterium]|nr:T9SS type A sorting domain-containing protein [Bacteroidota bacterium]
MIDIDGSFEYSPIRAVRISGKASGIQLYPNPGNDKVFVQNAAFRGIIELNVYNGVGQIVHSVRQNISENELLEVDVAAWPESLYFFEIVQGGQRFMEKFIKVK